MIFFVSKHVFNSLTRGHDTADEFAHTPRQPLTAATAQPNQKKAGNRRRNRREIRVGHFYVVSKLSFNAMHSDLAEVLPGKSKIF